jgi:hypothetical protein
METAASTKRKADAMVPDWWWPEKETLAVRRPLGSFGRHTLTAPDTRLRPTS